MSAMFFLFVLHISFIKCQVSCLERIESQSSKTCCLCTVDPKTYHCPGECQSDLFEAPREQVGQCNHRLVTNLHTGLRKNDTYELVAPAADLSLITTCLPCHSSCLRCSSPDPGSCTACATGFFMLLITDGEGKCIPLEMVHSQEQSTADRVIDLSDRLFILVVTLATSLIFVVLVLLLCFHYRLRSLSLRITKSATERFNCGCDQPLRWNGKASPALVKIRAPVQTSFWAKLQKTICCIKGLQKVRCPTAVGRFHHRPSGSRVSTCTSCSTKSSFVPNTRVEEEDIEKDGEEDEEKDQQPLFENISDVTTDTYEEVSLSDLLDLADSGTYTTVVEIQHPTKLIEAMPKEMRGPNLLTSVSSSLQLNEDQESKMRKQECCKCENDERDSYRIKPGRYQTDDVVYKAQSGFEGDMERNCTSRTEPWSASRNLNLSSEEPASVPEGLSQRPVRQGIESTTTIFNLNYMRTRMQSMSSESTCKDMPVRRTRRTAVQIMRRCSSDPGLGSTRRTHNGRSSTYCLSLANSSSYDSLMDCKASSTADSTDTAFFFRSDIVDPFMFMKLQKDREDGNLLKTYTVTSCTQTASPDSGDVSRPVLGPPWGRKQVFSYAGGFLQEEKSDVQLHVPVGAVEKATTVEILSMISTDLDDAYRAMPLPGDEYIISPVVEYFAGHDFLFLKPVHILLPVFLPTNCSEDEISVYTFNRHVLGHIELTKLRLQSKDNTERDQTQSGTYYFAEKNRIVVVIDHFSGCFCTCKAELSPQHLNLVMFGIDAPKDQGGREVHVRLEIWDNRLDIKDFEKDCINQRRTVSGQDMHYIDRTILSAPEEDYELDKISVGVQLELKSEEDERVWMHCTRRSGDPIFPPIQLVKLKRLMACPQKCQRPAFPKRMDWRLTTRQNVEPQADDFECVVDGGYVMSEEGTATGPLHFVSDPETICISVRQYTEVADGKAPKDKAADTGGEFAGRQLSHHQNNDNKPVNADTTSRKQIWSQNPAERPPASNSDSFSSFGSEEGAVGGEEAYVSESESNGSRRSRSGALIEIHNTEHVSLFLSRDNLPVSGNNTREVTERVRGNQFPRVAGDVDERFNNPDDQYSLRGPWTDSRRTQRTPDAAATTTGAAYPEDVQPASPYPDSHTSDPQREDTALTDTSHATSSTLHSDYVELSLPVQASESQHHTIITEPQ